MNMKILGLIAGAALLLGAQSAYAVTITNGSFELGTPSDVGGITTLGNGSTTITGWTVGGNSVDWIGSLWQPSEGSRSLDLSGNDAGSISQSLNNLTIGQEYTVTFDLAGNPDGAPTTKTMMITTAPTQVALASFNTTGATLGNMGWDTHTYVFIALATTQTLTFLSQDGTAFGPALDNVSIAATPIPGAILLFGSALGGMGFLGYRRKKLAAAAEA
jgi:choice-of-anchor C domain-containing protein